MTVAPYDPRLPSVIGLHGVARSGKDTVAGLLAYWGYRRVSLADPVRSDLLALDPMISADSRLSEVVKVLGWEEAKEIHEVRRLMQFYATDVARVGFGENCWIQRAIPAIAEGGLVVIPDVRFTNEAAYIRRIGGFVVHIVRPLGGLGAAAAAHASESGIDPNLINASLMNDAELANLPAQVQLLVHAAVGSPKPMVKQVVKEVARRVTPPKPPVGPVVADAEAPKIKKPRKKRVVADKTWVASPLCWNCYRPVTMHSMGQRRDCLVILALDKATPDALE